MEQKHKLILLITVLTSFSFSAILFLTIFCFRKPKKGNCTTADMESSFECKELVTTEDFIKFNGSENLTVQEILDAPGEVIGKSSYGTLYKASLVNSSSLALLRFLRPTCTLSVKEVLLVVELLGSIRHPNLVPLNAFYSGAKGEKLMVHPFYEAGNVHQFIRDGNGKARKWTTIIKISIGIARGVHHLHTALENSVIHGNLKSKNVLLDRNYQPYLSDFGLHLLLNPASSQQMLETLASQGYKAPELIKMKNTHEDGDIYSLGIIFLELLAGKKIVDENPSPGQDSNLPSALRSAILNNRIGDLYHSDIVARLSNDEKVVTQNGILRYFQLAMACCSPFRFLRPNIKQVLEKLEEIR